MQQEIDNLSTALAKANDQANMKKESNHEQLKVELEKQRTQIGEQIDELDNEMLTKPEVNAPLALGALDKIKRKYEKVKENIVKFQDFEGVLGVENKVALPEMEIYEAKFDKRFRLWNNRAEFEDFEKVWYNNAFGEQDATAIVKQVKAYDMENTQLQMRLKKTETDYVLSDFAQKVKRVVEHCPLIEALGCKDL